MKTNKHDEDPSLRATLTNRKMTMIAIGGVIGAGLFVGSGTANAEAGPAVLLAYGAVALIVIFVMRMLAEMAVADPTTGSFSTYAHKRLGAWAGTTVGWLYAYQWCVTIGFEAVVGAALVNSMLPGIPTWLCALVLMFSLIAVNLPRVESFGTFEFRFAMIKVAAIVVFLLIGALVILGLFPGTPAPGLDNLTGQGGFAPNGWAVVLTASMVVFFSFFGTEAVTIAAGEAKEPAKAVRRGMQTVVWRILLFYVGSIIVVVTLIPWNSTDVIESPYVAVLDSLNIPFASTIMNFIVLTAVLSCLNAGIYTSSRMIYSLAMRGEGPRILIRTNRSGTPIPAVLMASSVGLFTILANYFFPTEAVYEFLLASSGSVAVLVYLIITITHLKARPTLLREHPEGLTVKMWAYPTLDIVVLIALLAVITGMAFTESTFQSLILTLAVAIVVVIISLLWQRRRSPREGRVTSGLKH
ncbi:amino acid permease [Brevibacterium linens]|uniref:GABA permease n=1 Tax=Brevibacterium linens TaxID=1703 RepID=A0A2H1KN81_BRELN|nr:amino acid permease [Brevibacterium linens]SMY01004.1 GABA permease [Brevibacterium linens]